jgi:hypothetical protein
MPAESVLRKPSLLGLMAGSEAVLLLHDLRECLEALISPRHEPTIGAPCDIFVR